MPDRTDQIDAFLHRTVWAEANRHTIAGDASNRRYDRLQRGTDTAILMDAPPDRGEDIRPFVAIARHLQGQSLSAPRILTQDAATGLLLLEDLGDAIFARVLETDPRLETTLYDAALDVLDHLQAAPLPSGLSAYDAPRMADLSALAYDWYLAGLSDQTDVATRESFCAEIEPVLARFDADPPVLILRDFHAENLIWLPDRTGPARVGLLDFQDACRGHPAYDLASLLMDARRDLGAGVTRAMLDRAAAQSGLGDDRLRAAYAAMGAQRNLRILGVFARLCLRDGKPRYLNMIPRVWAHLRSCLDHPDLEGLRSRVLSDLPPPTPDTLARLKDRCATVPIR